MQKNTDTHADLFLSSTSLPVMFDQIHKFFARFGLLEESGEVGGCSQEFCFSTPRICMHICCASITTITPNGSSVS